MKLLLVGDVMLGRLVNEVLKRKPPQYPWGNTLPVFEQADFRACNLECVLSDRGVPWSATPKTFHFRSDAKNVDVLEAARIDAVSLANNHVLDFEYEALLDTTEILTDSEIGFTGAGANTGEASHPFLTEVAGEKIAFFAFTDNEIAWQATASLPGVFYVPINLTDPKAQHLFDQVKQAKSQNDFVIVSAHWGGNWGYEPPQEHRTFARALINAGADIVYGHSPHVFRGIEIFKKKIILYSTGDFIDDYAVDEVERNDESFIFAVETAGKTIRRLLLYPTVVRDFAAHLAGPDLAESIAAKMETLCEQLGTKAAWDAEDGILEIKVT